MLEHEDNNFDHAAFTAKYGGRVFEYSDGKVIFRQGDPVDAVYYIIKGSVRITVHSEFGQEALIAILSSGDFFGERGIDKELQRISTATAAEDCKLARFDRTKVNRAMSEDPDFTKRFTKFILQRNEKLQENLTNLLFHTSEERLARILLTMANLRPEAESASITIPVSQTMLASMVGTTRSRITEFMNKFRRLHYIDYNGYLIVHRSLNRIARDLAGAEEPR
jgi:CRP/FNR family cyclic AMP-dependent transcriptional regulator